MTDRVRGGGGVAWRQRLAAAGARLRALTAPGRRPKVRRPSGALGLGGSSADLAVGRSLTHAAHLGKAAPSVLAALCESLGFSAGELWQVEIGGRALRLVDTAALEIGSAVPRLPPGVSPQGRAWTEAQRIWLQDLAAEPELPRRAELERAGARAGVCFPIARDGQVLAVVALYARGPVAPSAELEATLDSVAGRLAEFVARERAQERLQLLLKAIESLRIGVTITDLDGRILFTNPAEARMHGYEVGELMGQPARMLAPRELWAPRQASEWRSFSSWRRRSLAQRKDGRIFQVERVSDVVTDLAGHPLGLVTCSEDVTERLLIEERIRFLALHDPLTRLPNRALFSDRIGQALGRARHGCGQLAIVLVNIDRFRAINDSLGQFAGDQLLQEIAAELQEIAGPDNTVARIGGDEFGILLPEVAGEVEAVALAERVIAAVAEPRRVLGHELRVTASSGVAIFPDCGDDPEALLSEADRALVVAKNAGRNTVQVSPGFGEATGGRHLAMEMALHQAVEREQLDLRYQPVVAWPAGRVVGVEALVRWRHPVWGEIAPREFIPLAEMSGSVVPLGEWVLREACRCAAAWPQAKGEAARVAVNLSPVQLRQADLPAMVARVLAETGLDPRRLEIEITESGAMQNLEVTLAVLRELRAMKLTLTVDDFGTGHSSLSYLKLLPIHRLKVDQAFVRNLANEDSDAAIVSATIAMAHSLGLTVIAEGVESLEQAQMLERFGCDELQGFWFSAPLSAAEVQAMFEDPAGKAPQVYA